MSRILVTRPEPGASATAGRLRALGHEPVVLPLTRIERLDIPELPDLAGFDAVLATSANALRHAPERLLERVSDIPLLAVGEYTGAAARDSGFSNVLSAEGDAEALVELVRATVKAHARLLYLAGATRGVVLETQLQADGYRVEAIATYDAPEVSYPTDFLAEAIGELPIDLALVYSPRAGALFSRLVERTEIRQVFEKTTFLAISEKAATALGGELEGRARAAAGPTEEALLALLPEA